MYVCACALSTALHVFRLRIIITMWMLAFALFVHVDSSDMPFPMYGALPATWQS